MLGWKRDAGMKKKKPLDVGKFAGLPSPAKPRFPLAAMLAAGAIAALAIALLLLFAAQAGQHGMSSQPSIELYLSPSGGIPVGSQVQARAYSSCGSFSIFLDGSPISSGESSAEASFVATAGKHVVSAKNSLCKREIAFTILGKECSEGENRSCNVGGCPGYQFCEGGIFSACILPKKICVPGEIRGCAINSCRSGYAICNPCGTGFSPCSSEKEPLTPGSMACTGAQ